MRISKKVKMLTSVAMMLVLVIVFVTTASAEDIVVGDGDFRIHVWSAWGNISYNVLGISSRSNVTSLIMNPAYGGWRGNEYTHKALAVEWTPFIYDRVRFHSYKDSNEFRIDPSYSINVVGYGHNTTARYVYIVQRALYYLEYLDRGDIDGIWGPTTEAAVKSFQSTNGLTSDGLVGYNTWSRLASYGE